MADPERDEREAAQVRRVFEEAGRPFDASQEGALAPDSPPDRTRQFTHVNFSRMRTSWTAEDRIKMEEIRRQADNAVLTLFEDAYEIVARLHGEVRVQARGEDDQLLTRADGSPQWVLNSLGNPVENWAALGNTMREQFIHEIVVRLFDWSQRSDALWMDAMMAKGIWEELFARGYSAPSDRRLTIDDRTQAGHLASMTERYFAIFQAALSRRAQSLVRSMERIEQRLRDTAQL